MRCRLLEQRLGNYRLKFTSCFLLDSIHMTRKTSKKDSLAKERILQFLKLVTADCR